MNLLALQCINSLQLLLVGSDSLVQNDGVFVVHCARGVHIGRVGRHATCITASYRGKRTCSFLLQKTDEKRMDYSQKDDTERGSSCPKTRSPRILNKHGFMLHVGGSRVGKGLDYPLLLSLLLHHMRVMDLRPMHPLGYFLHVLLLPVTLLDLHGTTAAQLAYASIPTTEHTIHLLHRLDALQRVGEGHESVSLRALSQLVLHHAAHRERGVALAEQIGQDFSCHLPAQIAHEQPEIGRVPIC